MLGVRTTHAARGEDGRRVALAGEPSMGSSAPTNLRVTPCRRRATEGRDTRRSLAAPKHEYGGRSANERYDGAPRGFATITRWVPQVAANQLFAIQTGRRIVETAMIGKETKTVMEKIVVRRLCFLR